jgi:hypothetical protein
MDGVTSERMPFNLIKLFTGIQIHINVNNIREATYYYYFSETDKNLIMFLTECSNRLQKKITFWINYGIVKPVREKKVMKS